MDEVQTSSKKLTNLFLLSFVKEEMTELPSHVYALICSYAQEYRKCAYPHGCKQLVCDLHLADFQVLSLYFGDSFIIESKRVYECGFRTVTLANGILHSVNDMPVIKNNNGTLEWHKFGDRHRNNDKPALITKNGTQEWYQYGERHRDNNLPAVICRNGKKIWYERGRLIKEEDERYTKEKSNASFSQIIERINNLYNRRHLG